MPALDGLRAVAISMVIALHVAMVTSLQPSSWWHARVLRELGLGVQLFFVVSAFTLTMRAERDAQDLAGFALRRLARIGPAYWLAGLLYGAWRIVQPPSDTGPIGGMDVLLTAVFGTAWTVNEHPGLVPGGWSVSCEAAFYCALPLVAWLVHGRVWRAAALLLLAIGVAQLRFRHVPVYDFGAQVNPLQQAPVFMFGMAAATLAKRWRVPDVPGAALAFLLAAIVVVPVNPLSEWYLTRTTQFASVAGLAVLFAATHPPRLLAGAVIRKVGTVSFSMYLVHFALLEPSLWLARLLTGPWATPLATFLICTASTFAVSLCTYAWIEKPAIDWAASRTRRAVRPAV